MHAVAALPIGWSEYFLPAPDDEDRVPIRVPYDTRGTMLGDDEK